jgi:hypothetical protein
LPIVPVNATARASDPMNAGNFCTFCSTSADRPDVHFSARITERDGPSKPSVEQPRVERVRDAERASQVGSRNRANEASIRS